MGGDFVLSWDGGVYSLYCTIMGRYYYRYVAGAVGGLVLGYFCK